MGTKVGTLAGTLRLIEDGITFNVIVTLPAPPPNAPGPPAEPFLDVVTLITKVSVPVKLGVFNV